MHALALALVLASVCVCCVHARACVFACTHRGGMEHTCLLAGDCASLWAFFHACLSAVVNAGVHERV
jgi:hypothetical protein